MSVTRWNPFAELEDVLDRYHRAMGGITPKAEGGKEVMAKSDWMPAVDISETANEFLIKAEVPGIKREDIKVAVNEGVLSLTGERHEEKEEKGKKFHRVERYYGRFARSFTLPENVDESHIKAEYRDGMLLLHLKKVEKSKPKSIEISVD